MRPIASGVGIRLQQKQINSQSLMQIMQFNHSDFIRMWQVNDRKHETCVQGRSGGMVLPNGSEQSHTGHFSVPNHCVPFSNNIHLKGL